MVETIGFYCTGARVGSTASGSAKPGEPHQRVELGAWERRDPQDPEGWRPFADAAVYGEWVSGSPETRDGVTTVRRYQRVIVDCPLCSVGIQWTWATTQRALSAIATGLPPTAVTTDGPVWAADVSTVA